MLMNYLKKKKKTNLISNTKDLRQIFGNMMLNSWGLDLHTFKSVCCMPTLLLDSVNCKMWPMLSRSLHLVGRNWENIKEQIANTIDGPKLST